MCKPPTRKSSYSRIAIVLLLGIAPAARACLSSFPNSLIEDDTQILAAPPADFLFELKQIPARATGFHYINRSTTDADLQDLTAALQGSSDADRILSAYTKLRGEIDSYLNNRAASDNAQPMVPPNPLEVAIPTGLPEEFLRYLRGAIAYHNGKTARAISAWRTVLGLPAEQRRFRSIWAAFMIGRAMMDEKPDEAIRFFEQTRTLAQKGFVDSLGLATLSYGWQGRIALDRQQFQTAIDCYLKQLACDDPSAAWSLRTVASQIITGGPTDMANAAADENSRRVINAFLIAEPSFRVWIGVSPNTNQILQWFAAIEKCKPKNLENADRLAWIAYQKNLYVQADRWLNRGELTPLGHWVRAKLLLRSGFLSSAAAHLAEASRGFPDDLTLRLSDHDNPEEVIPAVLIRGEIGAIHLAQGQYAIAMNELLTNGFWADAAYIAERVLTVDELMRYVDDRWPADKPGSDSIRALLARRLMRLERGDEALTYFDSTLREKALAYHLALCDGRDFKYSAADRAELLWEAASIARSDGMELFGTELEPDNAIYGGSFPLMGVIARLNSTTPSVIAASADEIARAKSSGVSPPRRFHYRYLAADLAWEAIALMPDNDPSGAERLCEAGGWVKAQDAKSADRFYKELITRFDHTTLGVLALKKHWFPK